MRRSRVLLLVAFAAVLIPIAAHAAIPFFGPIIDPKVLNPRCALGWGAVMIVINNVISFAITLAIVFVAPLMIAYAGFLFVVNPVNASGKEEAKSVLTHTIVGIVIALSGWLIVDAIMAVLYNPGGALGTWSSLVTSNGPTCLELAGSLKPAAPVAPPVTVVPTVIPPDEQSIRDLLKSAGVDVPKAPCVGNSGTGCTTVANLRPDTVKQTMIIAQNAAKASGMNCTALRTCFELTGGTEPGHTTSGTYTHANGYKVDIRPTPALDSYIKSMTYIGIRGTGEKTFDGPAYKDSCGNIYVQEVKNNNLWDITVTAVCGGTVGGTSPGPAACTTTATFNNTFTVNAQKIVYTLHPGETAATAFTPEAGEQIQVSTTDTVNTPPDADHDITVSECPGDFTIASPSACAYEYIYVGGLRHTSTLANPQIWECPVVPGRKYYMNVRQTQVGNDIPSCSLPQGCEIRVQIQGMGPRNP